MGYVLKGGQKMKLTGAQIFVECLKEQGADVIFGYPGGTILPIYDELYNTSDIRHILTAHEQWAAHAADGYARSTGKVGVVLATSGPGATNTVTGIATAYMDSVPIVVFTGQVPLPILGRASFQEVDITNMTHSVTKRNYIVKDVKKLAQTIREAFKTARSGRPGPVLVEIPKDVQTDFAEYEAAIIDTSNKRIEWDFHKDEWNQETLRRNLDKAVEAINSSERPLIYAGGGVIIAEANNELMAFAKKIKSPVACSLMGMGAFPQDNPFYTGLIGMHGTRASNRAVNACDLLIAIGARFSDRVVGKISTFAPNAKVLHIDIDPDELCKNVYAHIPLCGHLKNVLSSLIDRINEKNITQWNEQIDEWKGIFPPKFKNRHTLNPHYIIEKLSELTQGKCIITTEVGQNQMWTAQSYVFKEPRTFISSGGLGTMGYGLPAAIGASIANPHKKIINVAGDGCFRMNSIELATVSRYNLPILQLVINNHALGMVRQWQDLFYKKKFNSTKLGNEVDFIKLANSYGISAIKITSDEEVEESLKKALNMNKPVVVECVIDEGEMVFPIVPPGGSLHDAIEDQS